MSEKQIILTPEQAKRFTELLRLARKHYRILTKQADIMTRLLGDSPEDSTWALELVFDEGNNKAMTAEQFLQESGVVIRYRSDPPDPLV